MSVRVERWAKPNKVPIQLECERQLRAEGFEPELWIDPPGRQWRNFRHDVDEYVWILSGKARVTIGGEVVELAAGDRVLIPAGALHSLENIGSANLVWLAAFRIK